MEAKTACPFPVDRKAMDESIEILENAVNNSRIYSKEKYKSLQRPRQFVPPDYLLDKENSAGPKTDRDYSK